jgi:hypothetical protein
VEALGELKGALRLSVALRVWHAEAAANVALGVAPLLRANHHNASSINARDPRDDRAVITRAAITAQLYELGVERLKELCGARSVHVARATHVTPRLLFGKVRTEFWRKVSVALVLQDLIGAVRYLACNVGNWCEHAADHGACTLRHAAHHTTNESNARNVDLLIERNGRGWKWLQEAECANQPLTQIRPRNDRINESSLQQELGALESGGEFVANRSSRDARAAESNQRIRLCNVQVTERTE